MTAEQIKLLKESYMLEAARPDGRKSTAGEYMRVITDGGVEINSSTGMMIIDEDNELIHGIGVNNDMIGQADFPVSIITTAFERVVAVETIMSRENFKKFLDSGYLSKCSSFTANHKDFAVKWIDSVKIQAQQPVRATPYYEKNANVISMHSTTIARDDGLVSPVTPGSLVPVSDEVKAAQAEAAKEKYEDTTSA